MIDKSEILAVCLSNIYVYIYLPLSVSLPLYLSLSANLNIFTTKPTKTHYTDAPAIKLKCLREKSA